jgi:hypothetical protein
MGCTYPRQHPVALSVYEPQLDREKSLTSVERGRAKHWIFDVVQPNSSGSPIQQPDWFAKVDPEDSERNGLIP